MKDLSIREVISYFSFLEEEFEYTITQVADPGVNGIIVIDYAKEGLNDIRIEREKSCYNVSVKIENEYWGLPNICRYLYPEKIIRADYSTPEKFKHIVVDTKEYLNMFFENKGKISERSLNDFYAENPGYSLDWL